MAKSKKKAYIALGLTGAALLIVALVVLAARFLYKPKMSTAHENRATDIVADDSEIRIPQPLPERTSFVIPRLKALDAPLVNSGKIMLGTSIPKTGELGLAGRGLSDGLFLFLNKTNTVDHGVWRTCSVSLDQRDDSGLVARALPHVYDLLSKSPLFLAPAGDIVFEKVYFPLLRQGAIAVFFPAVGLRQENVDELPVVWFRPSYALEVAALIKYALRSLKVSKMAVFYEESAWGLEAKKAAEAVLKKENGCALCASASYQPNTVTIQGAVSEIKKTAPQVVLCLAGGRATYNFIREALNQQMHAVSYLGLSRTAAVAPQLKKARGVTLFTASVVPNPHKSQLPIVASYRTFMQRYLPNKGLSTESLEGYIAASLFIYFCSLLSPRASAGDLMKLIKQPREILFKGLRLYYKNHSLSSAVWINGGVDMVWDEWGGEDA